MSSRVLWSRWASLNAFRGILRIFMSTRFCIFVMFVRSWSLLLLFGPPSMKFTRKELRMFRGTLHVLRWGLCIGPILMVFLTIQLGADWWNYLSFIKGGKFLNVCLSLTFWVIKLNVAIYFHLSLLIRMHIFWETETFSM